VTARRLLYGVDEPTIETWLFDNVARAICIGLGASFAYLGVQYLFAPRFRQAGPHAPTASPSPSGTL
jgi:hypothetical protein